MSVALVTDDRDYRAKVDAAPLERETPEIRLPDVRQPPPCPPLDDPMFAGLAGAFVNAVLPETEADPVALLVHFLVGFGNLVGRGPHFLVEATRHPCNLNALVVGPTNRGRKGTAWDWVRLILRDVDPVWAKRIKGGLSSGEGLIAEVKDDPKAESPKDPRLMVLETEFGGILKKMGREGNTLSSLLRQAWDGHAMSSMTKDPMVATAHHISVVGHVTPEELNHLLDKTDVANGLVNRFVVAYVRRSKLLPEGGDVSRVPITELRADVTRAWNAAHYVDRLRRDDHARDAWAVVYRGLTTGRPGQLGNVISRAAPIVTRLSCVYALLDHSSTVRVEHLVAALSLWRYAEMSCAYVFGESLGDPMADTLLEELVRHPEGLSRSAIRDLFKRNQSATSIAHALESLARHGLATRLDTPGTGKPGRRTEIWVATAAGPPPDIKSFLSFRSSDTPEKGANPPPITIFSPNDLNDLNTSIGPHNNSLSLSSLSLSPNRSYLNRSDVADSTDIEEQLIERRAMREEGDE